MYKDELAQVQSREQLIGKIQGVVQRWFSIYAAVRMVSNAIKSVISTIKELDATITEIAIVTKMSQSDLWSQMDQYTELARKYAASISGVYKVSQLYYQQGLGKSDVMALTE
jgi:DNA repair ATPase RecN